MWYYAMWELGAPPAALNNYHLFTHLCVCSTFCEYACTDTLKVAADQTALCSYGGARCPGAAQGPIKLRQQKDMEIRRGNK